MMSLVNKLLFMAASLLLVATPSWANTITGESCRAHLIPATRLAGNTSGLSREQISNIYAGSYIITQEVPNILGMPMTEIAQMQSQTPMVRGFITLVQRTISDCAQHCQGIRRNDGQMVNCSELGRLNLNNLRHKLDQIDGQAVAEATDDDATPGPNPECAFNPNAEGCQIAEAPAPEAPADPDPVAPRPTTPEERPIANQAEPNMDAIYWQDARQKFLQEQDRRASQLSVY
jgi:hypothetical protein